MTNLIKELEKKLNNISGEVDIEKAMHKILKEEISSAREELEKHAYCHSCGSPFLKGCFCPEICKGYVVGLGWVNSLLGSEPTLELRHNSFTEEQKAQLCKCKHTQGEHENPNNECIVGICNCSYFILGVREE
jgi:hypothetical protein